jgi:hypothetical protein
MTLPSCQQKGDTYKKPDKTVNHNQSANDGDDLTDVKTISGNAVPTKCENYTQFSSSDIFYNLYVTKPDSAPIL